VARQQPRAIALAWVLAQVEGVFTIPGTRSMRRLRENFGALEVRFSADELEDIRRDPPETAGARYGY
jgi:aryl-alcohol dehydrogenase-like predicted oxidoreductase